MRAQTCPKCNGWKEVEDNRMASSSRINHVPCPTCSGVGYILIPKDPVWFGPVIPQYVPMPHLFEPQKPCGPNTTESGVSVLRPDIHTTEATDSIRGGRDG